MRSGVGPAVRKALVVACDALGLSGATALTTWLLGAGPLFTGGGRRNLVAQAAVVVVSLLMYARAGLYKARHCFSRINEWAGIAQATMSTVACAIVFSYVAKIGLDRDWIVTALGTSIAFGFVTREIVRRVFRHLRASGRIARRIAIVGDNVEGLAIGALLSENPGLGYETVGYFGDGIGTPCLGSAADVEEDIRLYGLTGVIIATSSIDSTRTNELVRGLTDRGYHVNLSSSLRDIAPERLVVMPIERFPALYVEPVRRTGWRAICKRAFELLLVGSALLVAAPVLAVAAVAIKLDSPGPVLFRQRRFGRNGRVISVLKLRTMRNDAERLRASLDEQNECSGMLFKMKADPRITRVGRILRRTSIDELPQLWNIMRGDMSLIGPRPLPVSDVEGNWTEAAQCRLRVRPGLTGLWQVSKRGQAGDEDLLRLDLYYVDNWSLWVDTTILAKTVTAVIRGSGAH